MSHRLCSESRKSMYKFLLMIATLYIFYVYIFEYKFLSPHQHGLKALEVGANLTWWHTGACPYSQSLTNSDYRQLVDLNNFQFLINNRRCDGEKVVLLVVFVSSNPQRFEYRKTIRDTWGNERNLPNNETMRVVFLLGTVLNATLQQELANENELYRDIVQGNFIDAYFNLTYKYIMGLGWVTRFCQQARFILKTDDDVFANIPRLARTLIPAMGGRNGVCHLLMCNPIRDSMVKRSYRSKWHVKYRDWASSRYPDYCLGWISLMSPDVAAGLYALSHEVPFFWVDDVYVTGILAQRLGVARLSFENWIPVVGQGWYSVGAMNVNAQQIYEHWNNSLKGNDNKEEETNAKMWP